MKGRPKFPGGSLSLRHREFRRRKKIVKVEKRTRDSRNEKRISMEDFEVGSSLAKYIFVYMYV